MSNFYYSLVKKHKKRLSFIVLVSFLATFIFVRIYVLLGSFGIIDDPYLYVKGYHIHHLNYGIITLSVAGFMALIYQDAKNRSKIGVLYGIGLGLTFDEFGMWLRLEDNYWTRISYDAVIIISLIFISIIYFPSFWHGLVRHTKKGINEVNKIKKITKNKLNK